MAFPLILLAGCIGLLQYHGIQFWTERVDPATGWAWSLLLEAAALWLWYSRRRGLWVLGLVATSLTLAGPLHHVASPLFRDMAAADTVASAAPASVATLEAAIATDEEALRGFLAAAEKRSGWQSSIERTQAALDAKRTDLRKLLAQQQQAHQVAALAWQQEAIITMQAVALVLFQLVAVLATRTLSAARVERGIVIEQAPPLPHQATPKRSQEPPSLPHLRDRLSAHLEAEGLRVGRFAEQCGLDRREVSAVLNWREERRAASRRVVERLAAALPG